MSQADLLTSGYIHYQTTWSIQNSAAANFCVNLKYDQRIDWSVGAGQPVTSCFVRAYNGSWDKWLAHDGTWAAGPAAIGYGTGGGQAYTPVTGQWQTYEVTSEELTTSYTVAIHVYLALPQDPTGSYTIDGTWFDNIELYIVRSDEVTALESTIDRTVNSNYNLRYTFPDRLLGDIDEQDYENKIYRGVIMDSSSWSPRSSWQIDGSSYETLLTLSDEMHYCMRQQPIQILRGTLYGLNNFMTVITDTTQSKDFFTNYATWDLKEMTWEGEWVELPSVAVDTTNLITGWTNDDWDTFTSTAAVINTAVEGTGAADTNSNSISFDEGEEFYLAYSLTKNSGDWVTFNFAGDTHTASGTPGNATLTATSTGSGTLGFDLGVGETANYGTCTVYLYRKYGY